MMTENIVAPEDGVGFDAGADLHETKASIASSVFNLVNNIIGAGLLTMPWALRESSLVTGLVLISIVGFFNAYSFMLLAKCCDLSGTFSYKEMGARTLGRKWGILIQVRKFDNQWILDNAPRTFFFIGYYALLYTWLLY